MECFSGFWPRRQEGDPSTPSWFVGGLNQPPAPQILDKPYHLPPDDLNYFQEIIYKTKDMDNVDLRDVVRQKALKHRSYYDSLLKHTVQLESTPAHCLEMAPDVSAISNNTAFTVGDVITEEIPPHVFSTTTQGTGRGSTNTEGVNNRQRKRVVYEKPSPTVEEEQNETEPANVIEFKSVKQLREHYQAMLEKTYKTLSLKEDGREKSSDLLVPPSSGYCSSAASGASDDEKEKNFGFQFQKKGLRRSASSDSAVLSDEEGVIGINWGEKKEEIAASEVFPQSPYSPRGSIDHSNVPSKLLLESKFVALPVDRKFSVDCVSDFLPRSVSDSRRESCFSEGDEHIRYRYWRTPSVVVSDYSDDIMGLTLEDIEYIRNKREHSYSPCSSMHSSCSNLNFCGSTISVIEGDYVMCKPYRKSSNCSTCSTLSDEEDTVLESVPERKLQPQKMKEPSGWRKLRNIVQWTPFFQTYKKQRYPWVQLAGHQGNFKAGPDQGTILKKLCAKEEKCFKILMKDILRPYVPEYKGLVTSDDGECSYIQLQDLLGDFVSPCVMDCKIGVRTYLEEELAKAKEKPKLRKDMYEKMCQIDTGAPTDEEHRLKGVTKPRYMVWRETISSTATLGFRIEGIRSADGTSSKDFKTTKTKDQVIASFEKFTDGFPHAIPKYIQRLKAIKATLESSSFFNSHEMIGSSLLFVHDRYNASVWLIDFAKTVILPEEIKIDHRSKWKVGNHEDGYMIGVNNLIKIFMTVLESQPVTITPPLTLQEPPEVVVPDKNKENEDRNDNT